VKLQDVQQALQDTAEAALQTILEPVGADTAAQFPILFRNQNMTSPPSKWAQVFFLNSDNTPFTMGREGEDRADGILNINVRYQKGTGSDTAISDFEALRAAFPRGWIASGDVDKVVFVERTKRVEGEADAWFIMTCVVYWYAFIAP